MTIAKPIFYSGTSSSGGHAFVCDGYDANDKFHFNWGWSGVYDNYYTIGSLKPGKYNFSNENSAIINIAPTNGPCPNLDYYFTPSTIEWKYTLLKFPNGSKSHLTFVTKNKLYILKLVVEMAILLTLIPKLLCLIITAMKLYQMKVHVKKTEAKLNG